MTRPRPLICALCVVPLASVAAARSDGAVDRADLTQLDRMGMEVGTFAADYPEGWGDTFEAQILVRMAFVAQQRAIAHTCDGFDVDISRCNDAMREIMQPVVEMIEVPRDATGVAINVSTTRRPTRTTVPRKLIGNTCRNAIWRMVPRSLADSSSLTEPEARGAARLNRSRCRARVGCRTGKGIP